MQATKGQQSASHFLGSMTHCGGQRRVTSTCTYHSPPRSSNKPYIAILSKISTRSRWLTSVPGCQDSLHRLQKARKHLLHCAQFSASSTQALEQRGQYTTSGIFCREVVNSRSSQRCSCSSSSSPIKRCTHVSPLRDLLWIKLSTQQVAAEQLTPWLAPSACRIRDHPSAAAAPHAAVPRDNSQTNH